MDLETLGTTLTKALARAFGAGEAASSVIAAGAGAGIALARKALSGDEASKRRLVDILGAESESDIAARLNEAALDAKFGPKDA